MTRSEPLLTNPKRKATTDYRTVVAEMFAEIIRLNQLMSQDQAAMDREVLSSLSIVVLRKRFTLSSDRVRT